MQNANVIGVLWAIPVTLLCYSLFVYVLKRYSSRHHFPSTSAATPYGEYMAREGRGFTECVNVHTRAGVSDVFFDVDNWLTESPNVDDASDWIVRAVLEAQSEARLSGNRISGLAFVEKDSGPTGLISMQHLIAKQAGMKTCTIRLRRWPFLPQAAIKGDPPSPGSQWAIISDVATTGGHIMKAADVLKDKCWGAECTLAIVLLNRGGDEVTEAFKNNGIKLVSNDNIRKFFNTRSDLRRSTD